MSSYTTIAEASTYFESRLRTDAWDNAEDVDREKALAMATQSIDRLNFHGSKSDDEQELQFPRYTDSVVPQDIKNACSEIALKLLEGIDPDLEFETLSMVSQGYSNVRSTYDRSRIPEHLAAGIPSIAAWRLIKPYLRDAGTINLSRAT
jgi:hypothetical protein